MRAIKKCKAWFSAEFGYKHPAENTSVFFTEYKVLFLFSAIDGHAVTVKDAASPDMVKMSVRQQHGDGRKIASFAGFVNFRIRAVYHDGGLTVSR